MSRRPSIAACAVLALALGACSSERTRLTGSTTPTDPTDAPVITTNPPTTTTDAVVVTEPPTTQPATTPPATTPPAVPGGWAVVETGTLSEQAAPPCCASNWYGEPSPPLPSAGDPLPDGSYAVSMVWADDPAQPLQLTIHRFEQCSVLPAGSCEETGGTYLPDELGIEDSASIALDVPLDDRVRVVLMGFRGFSEETTQISSAAQGNGSDLAELAVAVETAYAEVLATPLLAGEDPDAIVASIAANPSAGFGPGLDGSPFSVSYTYGSAPPLIYQAPYNYETTPPTPRRGVDVLIIPSIQVIAGQVAVYVYAGWYP